MSVPDSAVANRETLKALLEQKRHGQGRGPASYADRSRELAPLSSAQRSLWLTAQTQAGKRAYSVQLALALEGSVDVDAVRTSFERVVERHEVLRSRFDIGSEGVLQAQRTAHGLHFATRAIAATEEAEALVRSECLHEFDLAADPLLRV